MENDKQYAEKDFHIVLFDNNEGFVAPAVPEVQANLHEDIPGAIGVLEDTIDSFKTLVKGVPESTDMYKCMNLIHINLKTARSLVISTNCATGAAQVAAKNMPSSVPLLLVRYFLNCRLKGEK